MKLFKRRKQSGPLGGIEDVLERDEVPVFPTKVLDVLNLLRDTEVCFSDIAEALQWDPGLVAKVLRTVNSAAYGTSASIMDVRHAVSFLGRSQLEQLVIAMAVKDSLPTKPAPGFEPARFWRAASFRAALSRTIANELHPAKQGESFTAGLLQDMAVPLLATARPEQYGEVLSAWHADPGANLERLEESAFGWNHAQVGAALGRDWTLPEALARVIESHHDEGATDQDVPPAIRLVALLRETESEHGLEALIEEARSGYGLGADWMQDAVEICQQQAAELASELA